MSRAWLVSVGAALVCSAASLAAQGPARQAELPAGAARELVQANCTGCHGTAQITGSAGYSSDEWRQVFGSMVELPEAEAGAIAAYLATHFPPRNGRRPVLVDGPARIRIQEWTVPTLGQRSRDPFQTSDGAIWWTGQYASLIGRLDPRTGAMKEIPLAPDARPHGIAGDPADNIWFTGNGNGTLGRIDARTHAVTVYPTRARDPHTPIVDSRGTLWFTAQNSNIVGRFVPATGELTEVEVPTPRARPYGIQIDSRGVPWFTLFGTNKLGSIDPATLEIREHALPEGARPRRLAMTSDGMIWYTDFARGYLGRFDPRTVRPGSGRRRAARAHNPTASPS